MTEIEKANATEWGNNQKKVISERNSEMPADCNMLWMEVDHKSHIKIPPH